MLQKELDDVEVPAQGCPHEHRHAFLVERVDSRAARDAVADHVHVALARCEEKVFAQLLGSGEPERAQAWRS